MGKLPRVYSRAPFNLISWSARGGACNNPYVLDYTCWGSSGGSAVAAAANMCAAAVGTETDGSIVGPANVNLVVGLKPSVGLIPQSGIIPISSSQDTAGPLTRNVMDAAILLGAMQSPFGRAAGYTVPADYAVLLVRGALNGARIGVDRRFFDDYGTYGFPGDEDTVEMAYAALEVMQELGATLIETDTGEVFELSGDEFTVLQFEFKAGIARYLSTLTHTRLRSLDDLIAFNLAHCPREMRYYGQELFEIANATSGDLSDPLYLAARENSFRLASSRIDEALQRDNLDIIVAPHLTNTTGPAVAGYPNLSLPLGVRADGRPASMLMYSGYLNEARLLALAYDLEQELRAHSAPFYRPEYTRGERGHMRRHAEETSCLQRESTFAARENSLIGDNQQLKHYENSKLIIHPPLGTLLRLAPADDRHSCNAHRDRGR
jgi:amidase